jgi:hypothetical protein
MLLLIYITRKLLDGGVEVEVMSPSKLKMKEKRKIRKIQDTQGDANAACK